MAGKHKLNGDQQAAFKAIQKFIEHPAADTFVLKGYAGTGKTFLMQYLAKWLDEKKYKFSLLASTGRAAAVLRGKTGFTTSTVHSELYRFTKLDGVDNDLPEDAPIDQYGQLTMLFSLRNPDDEKRIYIVDESSMLSSDSPDDPMPLIFGSGRLLNDFFSLIGSNKIIFVGDPGQLPPVHHIFSPALQTDWLAAQSRNPVSITLNKIERTDPDNDILLLAASVRNYISAEYLPSYPKLRASRMNCVNIHAGEEELLQEYVHKFQDVGAEGTIAIARSNRMVRIINDAVRTKLFGKGNLLVEQNDVLLVVQNNYSVPLANGDFISVLALGETTVHAGLHFQKARIKAMLSNTEHEILISLDILYGNETNFTRTQNKMLMVDFDRRMRRKGIMANTDAYKEAMMKDQYLNCLRVKFGYAVTCHKAQGGEWDDVYLFLEKSMYAMARQELFRWWYTAITRARKRLHLANNWWIE